MSDTKFRIDDVVLFKGHREMIVVNVGENVGGNPNEMVKLGDYPTPHIPGWHHTSAVRLLRRPLRRGDKLRTKGDKGLWAVFDCFENGRAFYTGAPGADFIDAGLLSREHLDGTPIEPPRSTEVACVQYNQTPIPHRIIKDDDRNALADALAEIEVQRQRANRLGDECGRLNTLLEESRRETKDALAKLGFVVWQEKKEKRKSCQK